MGSRKNDEAKKAVAATDFIPKPKIVKRARTATEDFVSGRLSNWLDRPWIVRSSFGNPQFPMKEQVSVPFYFQGIAIMIKAMFDVFFGLNLRK